MGKTITQLLTGERTGWAIVNEKREVLQKFRNRVTAEQWIPRMKLNKHEKLEVIELTKS